MQALKKMFRYVDRIELSDWNDTRDAGLENEANFRIQR